MASSTARRERLARGDRYLIRGVLGCSIDNMPIWRYAHKVLPSVSDIDVRPFSRVFRALSDETRVRMVALLSHGELCVCHIETALAMAQPNVSRHLGILKNAGIVDTRREGSWVYYRLIAQDIPELQAAIEGIGKAFGSQRLIRSDLVRLKKSCGPGACD
jgi:ArsR family transcriptional regulator